MNAGYEERQLHEDDQNAQRDNDLRLVRDNITHESVLQQEYVPLEQRVQGDQHDG